VKERKKGYIIRTKEKYKERNKGCYILKTNGKIKMNVS